MPWVLKGQLCWRPQKMMKGPLDELFPSYGCTDAWRNDEMFTCQLSNWKAQQCYQKRQKHALRSCWRHIFISQQVMRNSRKILLKSLQITKLWGTSYTKNMMRKETMKCLIVNFLKGTNAVIKKAKTKTMLSSCWGHISR